MTGKKIFFLHFSVKENSSDESLSVILPSQTKLYTCDAWIICDEKYQLFCMKRIISIFSQWTKYANVWRIRKYMFWEIMIKICSFSPLDTCRRTWWTKQAGQYSDYYYPVNLHIIFHRNWCTEKFNIVEAYKVPFFFTFLFLSMQEQQIH